MVYGSIYGASRMGLSEGSFDSRYAGPDGADLMVQEAYDIDQKMFEIVVEHDFLECAAMESVEMESALIAVNENFVTDMWDKIKELIKKIKDKIVSIAKAAAVKLNAFFTKDNAALVSKYKNKFYAADKSKIEIKNWREFKPDAINENGIDAWDVFDKGCAVKTADGQKSFEKDYSVDKLLSKTLPENKSTTMSSYSKDAKAKSFGTAKTVKASNLTKIEDSLTNYSSAVSVINDAKNNMDTELNKMDDTASKKRTEADNYETTGDGDKTKDELTISANCARYACTEISKAYGKIFSAKLEVLKENMKQCRSAFIKIASKGAMKESADLMEEEAELQDYVVESFFDQYSYDYEELIA